MGTLHLSFPTHYNLITMHIEDGLLVNTAPPATSNVSFLDKHNPQFPAVDNATSEGLLAIGGNLNVETLRNAYTQGIFPWYEEDSPILWWSPDPRLILRPPAFHLSKSSSKTLHNRAWQCTLNYAFEQVLLACSRSQPPDTLGMDIAHPVQEEEQSWITADMRAAYARLHRAGLAHSVEVWEGTRLIGGLYGVAIGKVFFGESMFSYVSNASKIALFYLSKHLEQHKFPVLDCQVQTQHLLSLGAEIIPRNKFLQIIQQACQQSVPAEIWFPHIFERPVRNDKFHGKPV